MWRLRSSEQWGGTSWGAEARTERAGSTRRAAGGFTLVEVLVAMTVSGIGVLAVLGALRMANDAADRVRDEESARLLAERQIVGLLAGPADGLRPARGEEGRFAWEEDVRGAKVSGLAKLRVVVKWRTRRRAGVFELVSMREMQ